MTWGCDKNNSRGDIIDNCITENNIRLLNDGSYTYLHPATETFTVDLSLCSPDILMEIDFIVESDSIHTVVIIFLLFLIVLTGCNLMIYAKKN